MKRGLIAEANKALAVMENELVDEITLRQNVRKYLLIREAIREGNRRRREAAMLSRRIHVSISYRSADKVKRYGLDIDELIEEATKEQEK